MELSEFLERVQGMPGNTVILIAIEGIMVEVANASATHVDKTTLNDSDEITTVKKNTKNAVPAFCLSARL